MAQHTLTNEYITINGVDLSDHVISAVLNYNSDLVDSTAMGTSGTRARLGGLKDWSVSIEFQQDYAAGKVDATLFPLVGSTFTVAVKPVNAATSATNPQFSGTGILESYSPVGGGVGDLHRSPVTIQAAGTLSRATS